MLHAENSQRAGRPDALGLSGMELGGMGLSGMELGGMELGGIVAKTPQSRDSAAVDEHDSGVDVMMHDLAHVSGLQGRTNRSSDQQRLAERHRLLDSQKIAERAAFMSALHQVGPTTGGQPRGERHARGRVASECLDCCTSCGEQRQSFGIELAESEVDDDCSMSHVVDTQPCCNGIATTESADQRKALDGVGARVGRRCLVALACFIRHSLDLS